MRSAGGLEDVGVDLPAELAALGVDVRLVARGRPLSGPAVHLCDAESDLDLVTIAEAGKSLPGPTLWCGTAGLARALAGAPRPASLPGARGPWLALIGTPHPVSREQALSLADARPGSAVVIAETDALPPLPSRHEGALVHLDLPSATSVDAACSTVDAIGRAMAHGPPPGLLVVSGGDTLMRLCRALDAEGLSVVGELTPGIPVSILEGGAWAGVAVVSKSGGFGAPSVLLDIIELYERG